MKRFTRMALLAGAVGLALAGSAPAQADKPLTILASVPGLKFPFFVHMMNQMKAEAEKLGDIKVIETDGQDSSPKQTADVEAAITQGVDGIVISPNDVDAMAPAHPAGGRRRHPGRHHRPPRRQGAGHPRPCRRRQRQGRRGAGRADHEALPGRRQRSSTCRASPAPARRSTATRACTTSSTRHADKYKFVFEQTAELRPRRGPVGDRSRRSAGMDDAAGRDRRRQRRHGARRDGGGEGPQPRPARSSLIGFDALPEALAAVRDGGLTATVEQFPGGQSRGAVAGAGRLPARRHEAASRWSLLTPIAITKDNLDKAERIGEVQVGSRPMPAAGLPGIGAARAIRSPAPLSA